MSNVAAASALPGIQLPISSQLSATASVLSPESMISSTSTVDGSVFPTMISDTSAESIDPENIAKKLRERWEILLRNL